MQRRNLGDRQARPAPAPGVPQWPPIHDQRGHHQWCTPEGRRTSTCPAWWPFGCGVALTRSQQQREALKGLEDALF